MRCPRRRLPSASIYDSLVVALFLYLRGVWFFLPDFIAVLNLFLVVTPSSRYCFFIITPASPGPLYPILIRLKTSPYDP